MDAAFRRKLADDAIAAVRAGEAPRDLEREMLDFKEEAGTVGHGGVRRSINPQDEAAARALAAEVACFKNSEHGGTLVVGVDDKASGPGAFVGTYLDVGWLRGRIHALTQPGVSIDPPEVLVIEGRRIYLIDVPPALEEVRVGGRLRGRFGDRCEDLSGDRAREFLERRRNYDWSARPSAFRLSDAVPEAVEIAHGHYEESKGEPAPTDLALVRRLGVTSGDADDPVLNNAGALLLCAFEPDVDQLNVLVAVAEGVASEGSVRRPAPLLTAFDEAWRLLLERFPAYQEIIGAQRRSVRPIPSRVLREAIVNGLMHRDYEQARGQVVAIASGDPSSTLKVQSPGGFPFGVRGERLLSTRSQPRNPVLARALHVLGLAESEGVGIATMVRVMLRDGHPEPEIREDAGDVICRIAGGPVDTSLRAFFDGLGARDRELGASLRTVIAITDLLARTPLRPERLAVIGQCGEDEAFELLTRLTDAGVLQRVVNGSRSFKLADTASEQLRNRINYKRPKTIGEHWQLIRAYLDSHEVVGRADVAELLGVTPVRASMILSELYNEHDRLKPVGKPVGRGVRYELVGGRRS
jgi:ATP-dependent DNA helicase RecG